MRKELLTLLFLIINTASGLTCAAENANKPGTCITETYLFFGKEVHKACYTNPYFDSGNLWPGFTVCYATIRTGSIFSDKGSAVAEVWSTNQNQLTECADYNGATCDVFSTDGFTLDNTASDRGLCDASSANCVKCDSNSVEVKKWTGSGWITGAGNNKCESGCGADNLCDEVSQATWSNNQITGTPFEAYCGSACQVTDQQCRTDFGAHTACDYLKPDDVCATDYCTENKKLIDYNNNNLLDNVTCESNCNCDTEYETPLCNTECSASSECHLKNSGYNEGNYGCTEQCNWINCGLYAWETVNCYESCNQNSQCYNSAVCDLVTNINTCTIDNEAPAVSINQPSGTPHYNSTITLEYSVSDNADLTLDCSYTINNASPVSLGSKTHGMHQTIISVSEGWKSVQVSCIDDSLNTGYSNTEEFLYDNTPPEHSLISHTDLTETPDNSLINGDNVLLSAYWTDNFILDTAVLESDKSGEWSIEEVKGFDNGWSNFTINSSCEGDRFIQWRVRANDSAGNIRETPVQNFYVHNKWANFSITDNLAWGTMPSFTGWASIETNKEPDNRNSNLLGEFVLTHTGIGAVTKYGFKLNEALPPGISISLSNDLARTELITLSTNQLNPSWCQSLIKDDTCSVFMWLGLNQGNNPQEILNKVVITSEEVI